MNKCITCAKFFSNVKKNARFCSRKCQHSKTKSLKVDQWLAGEISGTKKGERLICSVRNYLIEQAGYKCTQCGWDKINPVTGKCPLEVNHIDGNSSNNRPENLQVICPNCHSLTPNWKALNKGNGNKERLRYSKLLA